MIHLEARLRRAERLGVLPAVTGYNRLDGPGSSLDLREFQQAFFRLPAAIDESDPALGWSRALPRTVGITIDSGTTVRAQPHPRGRIAARSVDYGTFVEAEPGSVPPTRENWLLKVIDTFGLAGVAFELRNLRAGTQSSGLGGSATATTAAAILANALAGSPLDPVQLIALASRLEQELGVSLTGTQEQSNVLYGGVIDYVWFPWGIPGRPGTGYGSSVRAELIPPAAYPELEARLAVFHTGITRASSDTNAAWIARLADPEGFAAQRDELEFAWRYREGLRRRDWAEVTTSIRGFAAIRQRLCPDYFAGAHDIATAAERHGGAAFPLGAGGGGSTLVWCAEPADLAQLRDGLTAGYREIPLRIRASGHELKNLPLA